MKKWGVLVTIVYGLVVALLILPSVLATFGDTFFGAFGTLYVGEGGAARSPFFWIWLGVLIGGEALLLFVSVGAPDRRPKPRSHTLVAVITTAFFLAVLAHAAVYSLEEAFRPAPTPGHPPWIDSSAACVGILLALWALWATLFFLYARNRPNAVNRMIGWLLRGSVLELLIVVPCHVVARRRQECCAGLATGYGLATGLAIMSLAFGPGVLWLYRRRLERYRAPVDAGST